MSDLVLDYLPVELFYEIFSYLSGCHILRAFHSINNYLNDILIGYDNYMLDISSLDISKKEFDLVCSFLRSEQIAGLKLGQNDFDLVNRFITSFSNSQPLIRLRSLWIDDTILIDELFLTRLSSIINYNTLISIRFDRIRLNNSNVSSKYSFDSLSHLVTSSSHEFRQLSNKIPSHLTYLHMFFDSIVDIIETTSQFCMLKRLLMDMDQLKYLTLILSKQLETNSDALDGIQWELFLSTSVIYLKTFNFKFAIMETSKTQINFLLNRFRSKWWLDIKQWFVEYDYDQRALITVPYFASKSFDNTYPYSFSLIQNPNMFCSNIENLTINLPGYEKLEQILMSQFVKRSCFNHVTRLSLKGCLMMYFCDKIRDNVDLSMIKYFRFSSTIDTSKAVIRLMENMTNLYCIHIQYLHSLSLFNQLVSPLVSIRRLVLFDYTSTTRKQLFYHICRLFPRLTHLTTDYHSRQMLCYLLNELLDLENVTVHLARSQYAPSHAWIRQHSRLQRNLFESKVLNIADREKRLILWINTNSDIEITRRHHHKLRKCTIQ
ncbi:unnamed protein product [Rotaria sp. Silwood2]|nr:unnamed protein product [Rotaria sp. Silwood2]CAF3417861.1 unnamed protein product [Rotaria sp. Silwood2]CAF4486300.1 unnamed protein product [Rotaria sp. Silwood2]